MSTTETAPAPAAPKQRTRSYVVLRNATPSPSASQTWVFLRNIEAGSAEAAVRLAAEALVNADFTEPLQLVAVPGKNFVPRTVTAQVQTTLKLS
jgi:hypothetical protein